jgi:hypothetical protein
MKTTNAKIAALPPLLPSNPTFSGSESKIKSTVGTSILPIAANSGTASSMPLDSQFEHFSNPRRSHYVGQENQSSPVFPGRYLL